METQVAQSAPEAPPPDGKDALFKERQQDLDATLAEMSKIRAAEEAKQPREELSEEEPAAEPEPEAEPEAEAAAPEPPAQEPSKDPALTKRFEALHRADKRHKEAIAQRERALEQKWGPDIQR